MSSQSNTLGTNYGVKYAKHSIDEFFATAVSPQITNDNWQGELSGGRGDRVNILSFGQVAWTDYTGADITFSDFPEVQGTLTLEKVRSNSFQIKNWNAFKAYATDPESQQVKHRASLMKREVDQYNLKIAAGYCAKNFVYGTDYSTGTISVDVSGNVTGSGTTFATGWTNTNGTNLGTGLSKAGISFLNNAGNTVYARVKTYTNATSMVIEDDLNDVTTQYTGGVATAKAYKVRAVSKIQLSSTTIDAAVLDIKARLDVEYTDAGTGSVGLVCPDDGRFLVVNSVIHNLLLATTLLTPYTPSAYEDVVKLGIVGQYRGFKVFKTERIFGDNSNGYYAIAGHPMGITHAFVPIGGSVVTDLQANFGRGFKQLVAYGSRVIDLRKNMLAAIWMYI